MTNSIENVEPGTIEDCSINNTIIMKRNISNNNIIDSIQKRTKNKNGLIFSYSETSSQ
jgi:hypothetical protein